MLAILVVAVLALHVGVLLAGNTLAEAQAGGWTSRPQPPRMALSLPWRPAELQSFPWAVLPYADRRPAGGDVRHHRQPVAQHHRGSRSRRTTRPTSSASSRHSGLPTQTVTDENGDPVAVRSYAQQMVRPRQIGLRFSYALDL